MQLKAFSTIEGPSIPLRGGPFPLRASSTCLIVGRRAGAFNCLGYRTPSGLRFPWFFGARKRAQKLQKKTRDSGRVSLGHKVVTNRGLPWLVSLGHQPGVPGTAGRPEGFRNFM